MEQYKTYMDERLEEYINKIKEDEKDEMPPYPVMQVEDKNVSFDLQQVKQIALSTADDPFYEKPASKQKFFPEAVVFNHDGQIVETINSSTSESQHGNYVSHCRDVKMKINDDRKIVLRFSALRNVQMVLLFVRAKATPKPGEDEEDEYRRATVRLINEETNQTLDCSNL